MTAKKARGNGRATPKGTKNPEKAKRSASGDQPEAANGGGRRALPGKLGTGTGSGKVARPVSHNRGNR